MKLKSFSLFIISLVTIELSGQTPVNGVRPFDVLAKNSLKFNKFIINPSFSHVREDESFISFYNKRKWIGFENSRTDYFFSLSGKIQELNAYGIGLFQNNESIYSTFGMVGNFARNLEILQDSNLTLGLNIAYLNSGINAGKIITNVPETILNNLSKYSLVSINPGINFGTGFFDIGIVANNLFLYNFNPSGIVQGNPAKNFGLHAMYTGYIDRDGILEKAKFSALGRAEIGTAYSGFGVSLLFNAPKAGWIQAGYDNLNGINAGIGFILAKKISVGYGIEKPLGNLSNFGLSHEFTLAYKLRGYGDYEDERPIVKASTRTNPKASDKAVPVKKKSPQELAKERAAELALKQQQEKARLEAERLRKEKELAEAKAKAEQEARLKAEKDRLAALKAKEEAEARAKAEIEARLRAEQDKNKALSEAERQRQERLANEARLKAEAAAKLKAEQDRLEKEKSEAARLAKEKAEADAKAKTDALELKKAEQDRLAKEKAEAARLAKEKAEADAKAKSEELAREKAEQDRLAKEKSEAARLAKEKAEADAKAKAEELAREKAEQDRLAKEKSEAARLAKEKAEAEELARKEASKTAEDKEIDNLSGVIEDSQKLQSESIKKFQSIVAEKEKELIAMRKANDDSEKGIVAPAQEVEFKSMSQANKAIESLKNEIALNIKQQDQFIAEYQNLAAERLKKIPNKNDVINQSYLKTIEKLKQDKVRSEEESKQLITKLEDIKTQTEIEKRRRIKKANFEDASAKYQKDRATLSQIKTSTSATGQSYKAADFDYGDSDQINMQIVKNVANEKPGFYMVLATHKDEARRDAFIKKAIQAGEKNIDFFYDVSTGTYFIYSSHYDEINEADEAMKNKGEKPYNGKMVIIKIEK